MFPGQNCNTTQPRSLITESYRVLRTNILYSSPDNRLLCTPIDPMRVFRKNLIKDSFPTYGSTITLKHKELNFSSGSGFTSISLPSAFIAFLGNISTGEAVCRL